MAAQNDKKSDPGQELGTSYGYPHKPTESMTTSGKPKRTSVNMGRAIAGANADLARTSRKTVTKQKGATRYVAGRGVGIKKGTVRDR